DHDLHRPRQRAKRGEIFRAQVDPLFVRFEVIAIARHLLFVGVVGQPLIEPSAIDRHLLSGLLQCPDDGITSLNAPEAGMIPASDQPPNRAGSRAIRSAMRSTTRSGGGPE